MKSRRAASSRAARDVAQHDDVAHLGSRPTRYTDASSERPPYSTTTVRPRCRPASRRAPERHRAAQVGERRSRRQRPAQKSRSRGVGDGELARAVTPITPLRQIVEQDLTFSFSRSICEKASRRRPPIMLKVTASWPISSGVPAARVREVAEAIDNAPRSMRLRRRAMSTRRGNRQQGRDQARPPPAGSGAAPTARRAAGR